MLVLANIALTFALAISLLRFALSEKARRASGMDRIGADIVIFVFAGMRWMAIALAIIACAALGRFGWIAPEMLGSFGRAVLALLVHAGLGLLVLYGMYHIYDRHAARQPFQLPPGIAVAICVLTPLLVIGLLFRIVNNPDAAMAASTRSIEFTLAALAVLGFACGAILRWIAWRQQAAHRAETERIGRADRERRDREERQWRAQQDAELGALDRDAPFEVWIEHNHIQYSDEHQARAVEIMSQRPRLTEELSEMLQRDDRIKREWANALTARIKPCPPVGVAPALAVAMRKHAAEMAVNLRRHEQEERVREQDNGEIRPLNIAGWCGFCRSILHTAKTMPDPTLFREPLGEVLLQIERFEPDDDQRELVADYRAFLDTHRT